MTSLSLSGNDCVLIAFNNDLIKMCDLLSSEYDIFTDFDARFLNMLIILKHISK